MSNQVRWTKIMRMIGSIEGALQNMMEAIRVVAGSCHGLEDRIAKLEAQHEKELDDGK